MKGGDRNSTRYQHIDAIFFLLKGQSSRNLGLFPALMATQALISDPLCEGKVWTASVTMSFSLILFISVKWPGDEALTVRLMLQQSTPVKLNLWYGW